MSETANDIQAPGPEITDLNRPYWDGLKQGRHQYQCCNGCGHKWLPARSECPGCLGDEWSWKEAGGGATLISWVVYRIGYHASFAQRLPYTVAVVELDEGPRMFSNIVGTDASLLRINMPLRMVIEDEGGMAVARFKPA
jgi:uncharacterized OB-fold protein